MREGRRYAIILKKNDVEKSNTTHLSLLTITCLRVLCLPKDIFNQKKEWKRKREREREKGGKDRERVKYLCILFPSPIS